MKFLLDDQTLFKNLEIFDNDFVPEELLYRDNQLKSLEMCLKPALKGSKPLNALIIGTTATGKTTSVKCLFKEIKEQSSNIIPIYINCQIYNTHYKIFSEIHKIVLGYSPPTSGISQSDLFDRIFSSLAKKKKILLIALDDSDSLFTANSMVIYDILRSHEIFDNLKSAVWCISQKNKMYLADDKVRSIFSPVIIEYLPYKFKEIVEILVKRAGLGLYNNAISRESIETIAEQSFDLRNAIESMKKAVLLAEADSVKAVQRKHINSVFNIEDKEKNQLEKVILANLKNPIESGDLYKKVEHIANNYTKFYRTLEKLQQSEKIRIVPISKQKGRSSLISIKR
ncbi:MAG: AAA family ATPase [Candidatus Aenigmarchaeota archaeon]|nr:AAA family ATPase [Candidatus Aenigmarchaeota archaeon]